MKISNYNDKRSEIHKLAQIIIERYDILNLTRRDMNLLLIYDKDEGIYKNNPNLLDRIIYDEGARLSELRGKGNNSPFTDFDNNNSPFKDFDNSNLIKEEVERVKHVIQSKLRCIDKSQINTDKFYLPVNNGLLELKTGKLKNFSPEIYFTKKIPIDYKKDTNVPCEFFNFLKDIFEGDEWQIYVLQEYLGYTLYCGYPFDKFLFLRGLPENGINVILELMKSLVGDVNYHTLTFSDLLKEKSAVQLEYYDKLFNICGEMGKNVSPNPEQLGKLVGDNAIKVDEKYEYGFTFKNRTKLLFTGDKLPDVNRLSADLIKKLIILDVFPKEKRIQNDEIPNVHQIQIMCENPTFLKGILSWALEGLQRLLYNNGFSYSEKIDNKINEMLTLKENHIDLYVGQRIAHNTGSFCPSDMVYSDYISFASELGITPYGKSKFYSEFIDACIKFGYKLYKTQKTYNNGKRHQSFVNISLKNIISSYPL
ncbi:phage/plasmid primase, P4 family [Methanohalobium evestigatum Z-7303]|uniref:Phage/plasmid primase, P4 family n=1 Tax=Methanohalobium evestigatum (strain ATCC BAA-1072 / DSM 3721 / NBRC 107634 / OCM 161 / Z-7303) TaxID=644295 RepID=D7E6N5_METEZ|nr:phage/plasmid primase, P4 family [Methanohalobium evestigatum]ADI73257.1 phage/plasmid primase, P4 family [Methanohalobium evestigatum Z-7303]